MTTKTPGEGQVYLHVGRDRRGAWLVGDHIYELTIPANAPVEQFWSFTVYDVQTRSMLETDQKSAGIDSNSQDLKANPDGSYTVWFAPQPPAGHEGNWVQTWPGKGWQVILRLYAPLGPWFDKSWKPGDIEAVQ